MGTILWFKRDLRIEDNAAPALAAAGVAAARARSARREVSVMGEFLCV